jgi:hypothetical protein
MLEFLQGRATIRKLRLFGVACCRLAWHLLPDPYRGIVEAADSAAEHELDPGSLVELFDGYYAYQVADHDKPGGRQAAVAVGRLGAYQRSAISTPAWRAWASATEVARSAAEGLAQSIPWAAARRLEADALHDLFGPPFFGSFGLDPRWRTADVTGLAFAIHEDRAFDRLPILADALMDAGCDDEQVIGHCRSEGPHVRGCWVVDLVLGKE